MNLFVTTRLGGVMKVLNKMLGAAALLLAAALPVAKADVVYEFTNPAYSGADVPGLGTGDVFAKATFSTITGGVRLRLDVFGNLPTPTSIDEWYFNLDGDASGLAFSNVSGVVPDSYQKGNECCTADGTGRYDFVINFLEQSGELDAGSFSVIDITMAGLTLEMIGDALSSPNGQGGGAGGGFGAAIHVQQIGAADDSGWFVSNCVVNPRTQSCDDGGGGEQEVPEPGTLAIIGAGLAGLAIVRRRRSA